MREAKRIIDCDVHQTWKEPSEIRKRLPKAFQQPGWNLPGNTLGSPVGVTRADVAEAAYSPAAMIAQHIEPFGIEKVVLTGSGILGVGVHPNIYFGAAMARAYNEALAETWLVADSPFHGSILIAPQDPLVAAEEIRKWAGRPRMVQVIMCSGTRIPLGQKFYWPIYEAAVECGLPLAIHPGTENRGAANGFIAGEPSTYLEWHTNLPQNYMGQVVSLLCEGVFEKYRELKFVCIEGGLAWIPHVLWRLDKNWKALRSTVPWVRKLPSEYAWEHLRFTTQPIEEPENSRHLEAILEMIHAEKTVMFSSDFPHWDNDSPSHGLPKLNPELTHRIFYQNAAELYRFEASKSSLPTEVP